jgi:hypothetical protein
VSAPLAQPTDTRHDQPVGADAPYAPNDVPDASPRAALSFVGDLKPEDKAWLDSILETRANSAKIVNRRPPPCRAGRADRH